MPFRRKLSDFRKAKPAMSYRATVRHALGVSEITVTGPLRTLSFLWPIGGALHVIVGQAPIRTTVYPETTQAARHAALAFTQSGDASIRDHAAQNGIPVAATI